MIHRFKSQTTLCESADEEQHKLNYCDAYVLRKLSNLLSHGCALWHNNRLFSVCFTIPIYTSNREFALIIGHATQCMLFSIVSNYTLSFRVHRATPKIYYYIATPHRNIPASLVNSQWRRCAQAWERRSCSMKKRKGQVRWSGFV